MNTPAPSPLTVYFDGACPVCSREIALYRREPGAEQLCWVDVAHCPPAQLGLGLSREAALARLHVRDAQGRLVSGARGFLALWQVLPRWAWLAGLLDRGPLPTLLEGAYRAFLMARRLWRRQP
jgi:predicted DCC family thiol-disulfide oxidoreductase YuxK